MKTDKIHISNEVKLCSACLLGVNCKYDGKNNVDKKVLDLSKKEILIPVCPEQLGGFTTPRERTERREDKVVTIFGKDVTESFVRGANETLKIARLFRVKEAIFKARSPSCGSGKIYDGTFSRKVTDGDGVTAEVLKKNGIKIISEEDLP